MRRYLLVISILIRALAVFGQNTGSDNPDTTREKRWKETIDSLNHHLVKYPFDTSAYRLRARVYLEENEYAQALSDFNIYLELAPHDDEARFERAVTLYSLKRYEEAISAFTSIKGSSFNSTNTIYFLAPTNDEGSNEIFTVQGAGKALVYFYIGSSFLHLENHVKAILYLDSALFYQPGNASFLISRGLALERLEYYDSARQEYEKALELIPDSQLIRYNLSVTLKKMGLEDEAKQLLEINIERVEPQNAYSIAAKGFEAFEIGNYKLASEYYSEALQLDPLNEDYLINRGKAYFKNKNFLMAEKDFQLIIQEYPDNHQAYFNMGLIEYERKDFKEAYDLFSVAILLNLTYGRAFYNRGLASYYLKNKTSACEDIKRASSLGISISDQVLKALCSNN